MASFLENILNRTITYKGINNKITTFKGLLPLYTIEIKYDNIEEKNVILNKIEKIKSIFGIKILGFFQENEKIYILTETNQNIIEDILEEKNEIIQEAIIEGHSSPIKKTEINNLFSKEISMCKIHFNVEKNNKIEKGEGTGFFCRINHKDIPFKLGLLTNNHILNRNNIQIGKEIIFDYYKEQNISKILEITSNRRVFTNEELDYTFIEIMDSDKIFNINEINRLLKIDQDIFLEGKIPLYVNVDIFILQFPKGNELSFSVGQIKRIDKKNMEYNASTYYGSSGSPIIRRDNYSIIGLHLGSKKDMEKAINKQESFKNNFGVTILAIINDLIVKMNKKSPNSSLSFNKNDNFSNLKKYDKLGLLKYKSKNCKLFTLVNSMKCNFYFSENFPKNVTSGLDNRLGIRLHNEMRDLKNYFYEGFQIYGFINNILIGALEGPPSSPYENGFFIF